MQEVEAKYRLTARAGIGVLRARLERLGAAPGSVYDEVNDLFDAGRRLRRRGAILRLRRRSDRPGGILTYKGPATFSGAVRTRTEWESTVETPAALAQILGALGFQAGLRYEKRREEWRTDRVTVALDSLPFGEFCEIEGPAAAIEPLARSLGLRRSMAVRLGYPALMVRHLRRTAGAGTSDLAR